MLVKTLERVWSVPTVSYILWLTNAEKMKERWGQWPGTEWEPQHRLQEGLCSFFFPVGARKDFGRDGVFSSLEDVCVRHNLTDLLRGSC